MVMKIKKQKKIKTGLLEYNQHTVDDVATFFCFQSLFILILFTHHHHHHHDRHHHSVNKTEDDKKTDQSTDQMGKVRNPYQCCWMCIKPTIQQNRWIVC